MPENWWDEFKSNRWKAEARGASIHGTVSKLTKGETAKGETYPVVTIGEGANSVEIHGTAIDLRIKLAEAEPVPGDRIRVTLTGLENTGQPSPMKLFRVEVKRASDEQPPTAKAEGDE